MNNNKMNNILIEEADILNIDESNNYKLDCKSKNVNININEDIEINLLEIKEDNTVDKTYNFYLNNNSKLIINKFYDLETIDETINIFLNGYNSSVLCNLSSISKNINSFKINVYHNNKNTTSKTNIHGVTFNSNKIEIENNGYIPKGNSNSSLIQDNKIIILDDNNSIIKPNLYIDEFDVEAMHGAYIGKFSDEELFYLKSRGLSEKDSYNLLMQGFLINEFNVNDEEKEILKKIITKYWR